MTRLRILLVALLVGALLMISAGAAVAAKPGAGSVPIPMAILQGL